MANTSLANKLRLQSGQRVLILNPPPGYIEEWGDDVGWDSVTQAGLRPVTQVSIDDVWPALRFRSVEKVGR